MGNPLLFSTLYAIIWQIATDFFCRAELNQHFLGILYGDVHAVDFHIFLCVDQNVLDTANYTGLNQIRPVRSDFDDHIRSLDLDLPMVDHISGMYFRIKAKGFVIVDAELGHASFGYTSRFQCLLHGFLRYGQRLRHFTLLMHSDLLA